MVPHGLIKKSAFKYYIFSYHAMGNANLLLALKNILGEIVGNRESIGSGGRRASGESKVSRKSRASRRGM